MQRKNDAAIRQQFVTERRTDSGLVTKRIHVSKSAIENLQCIGKELGFSDSELRSNENLSAIIELCISSFSDKTHENKPTKKEALYLMQLHNIVKFKEQQGYHDKAISNFLEDWGYDMPTVVKRVIKTNTRKLQKVDGWTSELIEKLKDESYIQKKIKSINECPRPKKVVRKVKKPYVRRGSEVFRDEDF